MADMNVKPKIQLRSNPSFNGVDKSPSPATKLLINHGKPNFTIQRSGKTQENGVSNSNGGGPLSPQPQNIIVNNNNNNNNNSNIIPNKNDNYNPYKSVTPSVVANKSQIPKPPSASEDASKVVLRRAKVTPDLPLRSTAEEDDTVPEFILRQRRIQERLAKENVLDFENRRSGYFTHVVISPTSTNRTSFAETMSSPNVVPSLEMPAPAPAPAQKKDEPEPEPEHVEQKENIVPREAAPVAVSVTSAVVEEKEEKHEIATSEQENAVSTSEEDQAAEEEVRKAIDEVNKAVAGEDEDEKLPIEPEATATTWEEDPVAREESPVTVEKKAEEIVAAVVSEAEMEVTNASAAAVEEKAQPQPSENGHAVIEADVNGHSNGHAAHETDNDEEHTETVKHLNGQSDQNGHTPGVDNEPKAVDLASEPNKHSDTVQVSNDTVTASGTEDEEMQKLAKLKFDIQADDKDVQVTTVLRSE